MFDYWDSEYEDEEIYEEPEYREYWDIETILDKLPLQIKETILSTVKEHNIELTPTLLESLFSSNEFIQMMAKKQEESTKDLIKTHKKTENKVEGGYKQETSVESNKKETMIREHLPSEETMLNPILDTHIRSISQPLEYTFHANVCVCLHDDELEQMNQKENYKEKDVQMDEKECVQTKCQNHEEGENSNDVNLENKGKKEMDMMMNDLKMEAKNPKDEAPHSFYLIPYPSIQSYPSISLTWINNQVCNLFFCPMQINFIFQDNMLGFLSVSKQPFDEILSKLSKHKSKGECDGILMCFPSKKNASNGEKSKQAINESNLSKMEVKLPMSFNNSRLGNYSSYSFIFDPGSFENTCLDETCHMIDRNIHENAYVTVKGIDDKIYTFNEYLNSMIHMHVKPNVILINQMKFCAFIASKLKYKHVKTLFLLLFDDNHIHVSLHSFSLIKWSAMASFVVSNVFDEMLQKVKSNLGHMGSLKTKEPPWHEIGRLKTEQCILLARLAFRSLSKLILRGNVGIHTNMKKRRIGIKWRNLCIKQQSVPNMYLNTQETSMNISRALWTLEDVS